MSHDLEHQVEMAALRRRIERVEVLVFGGIRRGPEPEQVMALFVEATRCLGAGQLPVAAVAGWAHAILTLDEANLLDLARQLDDPAPWRVFLRMLVQFRARGLVEEVSAAEAHLRALVRNVLDVAGLGLVAPDDMLRSELPIERLGGH